MEAGTEFERKLLESGVEVVGQPMEGVESAAIGFLIGTGARDEDRSSFGVSHFVEQMLFRGTEHLGARELSERFDAMGINHNSSTGMEMTLVSAVLIGTRVPEAIDLMTDVVRFPAFPEDALDSVRSLLLQEMRQRDDRPARKVMDMLREQFYKGSPLSNDVLGTPETLESLGHSDLLSYWRERYSANNVLVSLAGHFNWDEVVAQLARVTAGWSSGAGRLVAHEPEPRAGIKVEHRDSAQENIGIAFLAVPVTDPHYYAAGLAAQALGSGSNSRLFREVREKRGLAYAVQARFDGFEKTGLVRIYVGTKPERAHESVEVILEELRKLEENGIDDEELRLAKTKLKSQLVMRSESTAARMAANLRSWWYEQELHSLQDIKDRIDRVTVDEIRELMESLRITSTLAGVAIGPRSEDELFAGLLAHS